VYVSFIVLAIHVGKRHPFEVKEHGLLGQLPLQSTPMQLLFAASTGSVVDLLKSGRSAAFFKIQGNLKGFVCNSSVWVYKVTLLQFLLACSSWFGIVRVC
jgi:hypothetical protein